MAEKRITIAPITLGGPHRPPQEELPAEAPSKKEKPSKKAAKAKEQAIANNRRKKEGQDHSASPTPGSSDF